MLNKSLKDSLKTDKVSLFLIHHLVKADDSSEESGLAALHKSSLKENYDQHFVDQSKFIYLFT